MVPLCRRGKVIQSAVNQLVMNLSRGKRRLGMSILLAAGASVAARRLRALSIDGALAATAVGGAVVSGTGALGAAALTAFFASSSLMGRLPDARQGRQRRGNERDAVQVLANGGVAAILAVVQRNGQGRGRRILLSGFGGALAAATADTWATEIGSRASAQPRSIVTGRPVPVGTSGGVSPIGLLASAAGSAFIAAVVANGGRRAAVDESPHLPAVVIGGVCGAVFDSILGAAVQEGRFCPCCEEETELPRHHCGHATVVVRGMPGFDNDVVNFAATLVGAAMAATIAWFATPRSALERG